MDGIDNTFRKAPAATNIIRLILAMLVVIAAFKLRRRLWNAIQYLALCVPFFRQIVIKSNVATISQILGRLLKAGYPMDAALATVAEGDMLPVFNRMLRRIRARVLQGEDFAAAAAREWLLPSSYIGILSIGEGAGDLPHSLEYVSDYYQREAIKNCVITTRIAFPIIVVLVGCWVLMVYTYPFQAIITIVDTMTMGM
jgi:type II secretory pathway component PulF